MELFSLPKELSDMISPGKEPMQVYTVLRNPENVRDAHMMTIAITLGVCKQTESYFRNFTGPKRIDLNRQEISQVVNESLKNAIAHGSKTGSLIIYGTFFGRNGLCHGFKDEGDYFSDPETKRIYENRIMPENKGKRIEGFSGYHHGTYCIYKSSDTIHVDTSQNTLFSVQSIERLIGNI
jgi:hypothetical protein